MSTRKDEHFDIVLDGETQIVIIEQLDPGNYKVLLQGRLIGTMVKKKAGKFICRHNRTKQQFGGRNRREAATSMIFDTERRKS
jgi:hypothetical protein